MSQYQPLIDLAGLDGATGSRLTAEDKSGAGLSIASAGDINHDGYADFVVGAPGATADFAAYVVFGGASGLPASFDLDSLSASQGFRISQEAAGDRAGASVASAGDVNGDGFDDLLVGAPANPSSASHPEGAAYLVFGKAAGFGDNLNLADLNGTNGFKVSGETGGMLGASVSAAGDVNGDGYADLLLRGETESYVVFGKASGFAAQTSVSAFDGQNGFKLTGAPGETGNPRSVSSVGDVNGDGFDDVLVGASSVGPNYAGASYVVFGKAAGFSASLDLTALNGGNGFRLSGAGAGDRSGASVSSAGDINGDGYADLIVGAPRADANGVDSGAAYVVFGHAGGFAADLNLGALNGADGFRLTGEGAGDVAGRSVSAAGDINGDGFDDIAVEAQTRDAGGQGGAAYVIFGKASGFGATFDLGALDGANGFRAEHVSIVGGAVATAGDLNGDGLDDLLIGSVEDSGFGADGAGYLVMAHLPDTAVTRTGTAADQSLVGGNFDDVLSGLGGDDRLYGNGGSDLLNGGAGDDLLNGGGGADTASYQGAGAGVTVDVALAGPQATGGAGSDTLVSIENLTGSEFADSLRGGGGANVLEGRGGDDVLEGGAGPDTLNGGDGTDTASYLGAASGVVVNAGLSGPQGTAAAGTDTLVSIENLIGSEFADNLKGSAGSNVLDGRGGDDTLDGGLGVDTLKGGAGNDSYQLDGVTETVVELVGGGTDTVHIGFTYTLPDNVENLVLSYTGNAAGFGNALDNAITGNSGNNLLDGRRGQDTLTGGAGNDTFKFGSILDTTNAAPDRVADFASGDRIDLSAIDANTATAGDQAFHLGATAGHAGDAVLSYDGVNNRTVLQLYVDADALADATVWLSGDHTAMGAGDFVF